jgi:uncharacterized membrane protein
MSLKKFFGKIFQYFLQGLIILAPITITIWAVSSLFNFVDNILPDLVEKLSPGFLPKDEQGEPIKIPGTGSVLVLIIVVGVGYISSSFIVSRLVVLFDKILEKTPGIKIIYSTVKDFVEAFAGNKRKFERAVLVCTDTADVWRVGFITQEDVSEFELKEHVAVYIPQSYAFAGHLFFVKRDRIKILTSITAGDAMKFAISGGVTDIDEPPRKNISAPEVSPAS